MTPSIECISAARVALAEKMLREPNNSRLRHAFDELRQCLVDDSEREADENRTPCLLRLQAG